MAQPFAKVALRTLTAIIALVVFMTLIWTPGLQLLFALFVSGLVSIGLFEYYAIVRARAISPETIGGILAGTATTFAGYCHNLVITNFVLYGGCLLVSALHIVRGAHSVAGLASTVFGVFYVGWFGAHLIMLQAIPGSGPGLITLLFVAVVFTDSGAYFIGSAFGKHKLAPKASPNKSWEGAVGGFVCALIGMAAMWWLDHAAWLPGLPGWQLGTYLHAGVVITIAAQVGDLAESCLKRDAGVKDSGVLFPGHGGMLDRCDGFLFAAPVLYYMSAEWFPL